MLSLTHSHKNANEITCKFFPTCLPLEEVNFLWPPFSPSTLATASQILCFVLLPLVIPLGTGIFHMYHERSVGCTKAFTPTSNQNVSPCKGSLSRPTLFHQSAFIGEKSIRYTLHQTTAETPWHIKKDEVSSLVKSWVIPPR